MNFTDSSKAARGDRILNFLRGRVGRSGPFGVIKPQRKMAASPVRLMDVLIRPIVEKIRLSGLTANSFACVRVSPRPLRLAAKNPHSRFHSSATTSPQPRLLHGERPFRAGTPHPHAHRETTRPAGEERGEAFQKAERREGTRRAGGLHRPRTLRAGRGGLGAPHRHLHLRRRERLESRTRRDHPPLSRAVSEAELSRAPVLAGRLGTSDGVEANGRGDGQKEDARADVWPSGFSH